MALVGLSADKGSAALASKTGAGSVQPGGRGPDQVDHASNPESDPGEGYSWTEVGRRHLTAMLSDRVRPRQP
jgi:hypothetical protein